VTKVFVLRSTTLFCARAGPLAPRRPRRTTHPQTRRLDVDVDDLDDMDDMMAP